MQRRIDDAYTECPLYAELHRRRRRQTRRRMARERQQEGDEEKSQTDAHMPQAIRWKNQGGWIIVHKPFWGRRFISNEPPW